MDKKHEISEQKNTDDYKDAKLLVDQMEDPFAGIQRRKKRGSAHTEKPEKLYRDLIKSGDVRIVRRRGKPPEIIWVKSKS